MQLDNFKIQKLAHALNLELDTPFKIRGDSSGTEYKLTTRNGLETKSPGCKWEDANSKIYDVLLSNDNKFYYDILSEDDKFYLRTLLGNPHSKAITDVYIVKYTRLREGVFDEYNYLKLCWTELKKNYRCTNHEVYLPPSGDNHMFNALEENHIYFLSDLGVY